MNLIEIYNRIINEKTNYNKESTIYTYESVFKNNIKPFFNDIDIKKINMNLIEEFHFFLNQKKYSTKYKNKINCFFIQLFNYAIKKDYIQINYAKNYGNFKEVNDQIIKNEEIIKYQTQDELNNYIRIISNPLDVAFFETSFYTGARCGELQALTWNDLNFKTWKLTINKTLSTKVRNGGYKITNTKNRKNRTIPILNFNKNSLSYLYEYYKNDKNFNTNWFIFGGKRFYPTTTLKTRMKKYYNILKKENPNVNILTHHQFGRHSHVSYLKHLGATSEQIALRIGDTKEVVEKTYIHLYEDEQDKILELFK